VPAESNAPRIPGVRAETPALGHGVYLRLRARGMALRRLRAPAASATMPHHLIPRRRNLKSLIVAGVVLVVLGIVGLVYGGITYTKHHEQSSFGPFSFTYEEKKTLPIHPAFGGVVLAAGVVVLIAGLRRR